MSIERQSTYTRDMLVEHRITSNFEICEKEKKITQQNLLCMLAFSIAMRQSKYGICVCIYMCVCRMGELNRGKGRWKGMTRGRMNTGTTWSFSKTVKNGYNHIIDNVVTMYASLTNNANIYMLTIICQHVNVFLARNLKKYI